jgi:uncharacterized membrane protein
MDYGVGILLALVSFWIVTPVVWFLIGSLIGSAIGKIKGNS